MELVDKLYDWLAKGPTPECDRTLAAALTHAEPPYFDRIARVLLKRAHEVSWAGLIGHYSRLSPATRRELLANDELTQAGITTMMRSGSSQTRCNALAALQDYLNPRLAYLLTDALRDESREVRDSAARALRETARAFLDRPPPTSHTDPAAAAEYQADRVRLVRALSDALRTFDIHVQVEPVEAALWFADDRGPLLWETLGNSHSRCGHVVSEHLESWAHPRLTAFLLLGMARPEWRPRTYPLLQMWSKPAEIAALLRHSALLARPGIRRALSGVKLPWPGQLDAGMSAIPADLRAHVPEWVRCLGYDDDEKARLLSKWLLSTSPDVHRAAVYALAALDSEAALAELKSVAASDLPLATFARWHLAGRRSGLSCVSPAVSYSRLSAKQRATMTTTPGRPGAPGFVKLWQVCRRTAPHIDHAVLQTLRAHLDTWRPHLTAYAQSSDVRDRVLVLWILSTDERLRGVRQELHVLTNDPVWGIRQAAKAILQSLAPRTVFTQAPPPPAAELVSARQEVLEILYRVLVRQAGSLGPEALADLTRLLRVIHGQPEGTTGGVRQVAEGAR
jgi:hypothetical protein